MGVRALARRRWIERKHRRAPAQRIRQLREVEQRGRQVGDRGRGVGRAKRTPRTNGFDCEQRRGIGRDPVERPGR